MTKRKAKSKPKSKVKTTKPKATKKKAKKKAVAKKQQPAPFDSERTQAVSISEIVGDIEERMALDRLSE